MKILMVEDERMVARGVKRMLGAIWAERIFEITHVPSLDDAESFLATNSIDLLLLDLNLSGDDGFHLLSDLTSRAFQTIIISANTDRALESYDYGVLDFVPKPVARDRLEKALNKLEPNASDDKAPETGQGNAQFLSIKASGATRIVQVREVIFIEAAGKYSEVHTVDGKSHLHEKSLTALLRLLPANFHRIHRSTIANLSFAAQLLSHEGSRYELRLKGDMSLRVGRSFTKSIRNRLA